MSKQRGNINNKSYFRVTCYQYAYLNIGYQWIIWWHNIIFFLLNTHCCVVISCGVLETPRFGRKSNFLFVPNTKVTFECNQEFVLIGDQRRSCSSDGKWDIPEYGYTECLRKCQRLELVIKLYNGRLSSWNSRMQVYNMSYYRH